MKKGSSQVDIVISFLIFITFLVFMFSILEPAIKTQNNKQILLDFLKLSLVDEFKSTGETITTMTIIILEDRTKECVKISGGTSKPILEAAETSPSGLRIKDENGNTIEYGFKGGQFLMKLAPDYKGVLKIYLGVDNPATYSSTNCKNVDVDTGSIIEETAEIVLETSITELKSNYDSELGNYDNLKEQLGVPDNSDFWFSFLLEDGTKIEPEEPVFPNVDIFSTEIPVQYFDTETNLQIGILTVKVW